MSSMSNDRKDFFNKEKTLEGEKVNLMVSFLNYHVLHVGFVICCATEFKLLDLLLI